MRNETSWKPTRFVRHGDGFGASGDTAVVPLVSRLAVDRTAAAYWSMLRDTASGDLADLGCGRVPLYEMYRDRVSSVTCVDWADTQHDLVYADVIADLNEPLPFEAAVFDTVVLADVIEHLHTPHVLFEELGRVLRDHAAVVVGVPFLYALHEEPADYHRYTEHQLRRLFELAQLDVERIEPLGGPVEVMGDIVSKLAQQRGDRRALVARAVRTLCRTDRVRRFSDQHARRWPWGYAAVGRRRPRPSGNAAT